MAVLGYFFVLGVCGIMAFATYCFDVEMVYLFCFRVVVLGLLCFWVFFVEFWLVAYFVLVCGR